MGWREAVCPIYYIIFSSIPIICDRFTCVHVCVPISLSSFCLSMYLSTCIYKAWRWTKHMLIVNKWKNNLLVLLSMWIPSLMNHHDLENARGFQFWAKGYTVSSMLAPILFLSFSPHSFSSTQGLLEAFFFMIEWLFHSPHHIHKLCRI